MNKDYLLRLTFLGWDLRRIQQKTCGDGNGSFEFLKLNHLVHLCAGNYCMGVKWELRQNYVIEWLGPQPAGKHSLGEEEF